MSQLDDIMTNVGMPAFRRVLGDDATYTSSSGTIATWAVPVSGAELAGQYGPMLEVREARDLPVKDVPDPQPGDSLTVNGVTYRIDQALDRSDLFVRVAIR